MGWVAVCLKQMPQVLEVEHVFEPILKESHSFFLRLFLFEFGPSVKDLQNM